MATFSFTEEYLQSEPPSKSTMFQDSDYQSSQGLQWSFDSAMGALAQTIDSPKNTEARELQIDTSHTSVSLLDLEQLDANTHANLDRYRQNDGETLNLSVMEEDNNIHFQEKCVDINSLLHGQAVIRNLASERVARAGTDPCLGSEPFQWNTQSFSKRQTFGHNDDELLHLPEIEKDNNIEYLEKFLDFNSLPVAEKVTVTDPWLGLAPVQRPNPQNIDNKKANITHNTQSDIDEEESLYFKHGPVIPRELDSNNVVIDEVIINYQWGDGVNYHDTAMQRRSESLLVDVSPPAPHCPGNTISTLALLSFNEQFKTEKNLHTLKSRQQWPQYMSTSAPPDPFAGRTTPPPMGHGPIAPKSECQVETADDLKITSSRKRRHDSEDSDETYTPHSESPTRKLAKKRKPSFAFKDILELERSQPQSPVRRGRPPKRTESTVSSVCSVDENSSSISTQEINYRKLRDKNNESSKKSRAKKKYKEFKTEQLCSDLKEENKNLKIEIVALKNENKGLKTALTSMSAILGRN